MKPIYENNRKAPRMRRGKFSKSVVSKQLWRQFIKTNPEYKGMTWDQFFTNWKEIADTIRIETITNDLGVKLGSYTGELKLEYIPYKFRAENYNITEARVPYPNILAKGKVAKIKWERRWAVKFNKMLQFFQFQPTREMNILARDYMDGNADKVRMSRITVGGYSVWRQLNKKK